MLNRRWENLILHNKTIVEKINPIEFSSIPKSHYCLAEARVRQGLERHPDEVAADIFVGGWLLTKEARQPPTKIQPVRGR